MGRAAELEQAAAFEGTIESGLSEIRVVEHLAPGAQRLTGGEEHRPLMQIPLVDQVIEHIGGIRPVAQIADLIDHEDVRMRVEREHVAQAAPCVWRWTAPR